MVRKFVIIFYFLFFFIFNSPSKTAGLDCFQQPATATTNYADVNAYNAFTCPNNVAQCYKYVCVGRVYYVQRGCLDPRSPTQNCQVVQGQCQAQGGSGSCYTCGNDRCNGAIGMENLGSSWFLRMASLNLIILICSIIIF